MHMYWDKHYQEKVLTYMYVTMPGVHVHCTVHGFLCIMYMYILVTYVHVHIHVYDYL